MKRKLLLFVVLAMVLSLALTACLDREVTKLTIVDGTFEYEYEKDSTPDFSGLKVTATYSDGSTREITSDKLTLSELDTSTTGKKEFTITYGGKTLTVEVTVKKTEAAIVVTLDKIDIDVTSVLSKVKVGDTYSTADLKVTATYSDNSTKPIALADLTVTAPDTATAGQKKLAVSYTEGETTVNAEMDVTVVGVKTLTLVGAPAYIKKGETLDTAAITANVIYTDDTSETLASAKLSFAAFATTEAGVKELTATYLDGSAKANIAVIEPIGIEVSGVNAFTTGIPEGQDIDLVAAGAAAVIKLNLGYGTTVVTTEDMADKTGLVVTHTEVGGARCLTFTINGFSRDISVSEGAAVIESIAINFGTANAYVALGKTYSTEGIALIATYTNGSTEPITEGFTFDALNTATAGAATLTAHYEGMTATATVAVLPVSAIAVNGDPNLQVKKNGTLDAAAIAALTFTVTYSDGTSTVIDNSVSIADMTVGAIATDVAGNKTFAVTYKAATGNVPYLVFTEASIAINGTVTVNKGETPDVDELTFTVTYTNGSTAQVSGSEITLEEGFDAKFNEAGTAIVAFSYGDATGSFNVTVLNYSIAGIEQADFVNVFQGTRKNKFLKDSADTLYVVGDDNDFIYKLNVSWVDESLNPISLSNYTGYSKVYIIEGGNARLLEGSELDTYVEYIDEHNNAFNFSQAAVGKTFRIDTIPAAAKQYTSYTKSLTFKVVDGWNIYSAKELHILTNYADFVPGSGAGQKDQHSVALEFLNANGIARPSGAIGGMIVHGDITITRSDMPDDYFLTIEGEQFIHDNFSVFSHSVDYYNAESGKYEFNFYGNFFTIYSYNVPIIVPNGTFGDTAGLGMKKSDGISSSQLFKFTNNNAVYDAADGYYNGSDYLVEIENLYMMDDNPNDPLGTATAPDRAKRGVIGIKNSYVDINITNSIVERYYISLFADKAYVKMNLDYTKLHNAWQNHIMPYADNEVQWYFNGGIANGDAGAIVGDENIYINITNSELTECGGPVIFSQTEISSDGALNVFNSKIRTEVVADASTKMYAYVTADSIWFKTFGATDYMKQIQSMDALFNAYGCSFRAMNPLAGYNGNFMNLLYINMGNAFGATTTAYDVDGSFTWGGQVIMNMNDDNLALETLKNTPAPVFQSPAATSGDATWNSTALFYQSGSTVMLTTDVNALMAGQTPTAMSGNTHPIFTDDQIVLYYIGMGIVLGDYHAHNAAGDSVCKPAT